MRTVGNLAPALCLVALAVLSAAAAAQMRAPREMRFTAYTTGYGHHDNTPAGDRISHASVHRVAGGSGTYQDPITLAVGHSVINGDDILDYPAGTRFYIPSLRKYFVVEDSCGDGSAPQYGPCHTRYQGLVWLDLWVGGATASRSATFACEVAITGKRLVIQHPAANYAVAAGPILNGTCATLYSDTALEEVADDDARQQSGQPE
jgi:hypothetical protein